jgi:hypothetical protein
MTTKEFAQKAIGNGYTGGNCNGWDWIKENISELDYIFELEEYKKQNGLKYKCIPFLETLEMSDLEKRAIRTAWYIDQQRVQEKEMAEKQNKLKEMGYILLQGTEKELDGKNINFILDNSSELFGGITEKTGKLKWVDSQGSLWAFEKRHTRRGYPIYKNCNIYIKII